MDERLALWWIVLCAAVVVNAIGWAVSAGILRGAAAGLGPEAYELRRRLLWLSAVYVGGCGFRSLLPMVDVPRICLHETPVSMIFVGRSVATVAELAFAAQWTLLLRETSRGDDLVGIVGRLILPVIVVAEIASWSAVLLSNYLLHALENVLWTFMAAMVMAAFWALHGRMGESGRRFLQLAALCGGGYLVFMILFDVPMYVDRWLAGVAEPTTLAEGLRETLAPCVIEHRWSAWRDDVPWLSLYFTIAVWISIVLPHAPVLRREG